MGVTSSFYPNKENEVLKAAIDREKQLTEYHYPGYSYMGPGTKIVTNIVAGIKPINELDTIARRHDIDYISGSYDSADVKAILSSLAIIGLDAQLLRSGLSARLISRYQFKDIYDGLDKDELIKELNQYVAN